jgi:hypothetical protein
MPEPEQQTTLSRIGAFLASRPETACGEFTVPMLTGVLRVHRLEEFPTARYSCRQLPRA